MMARQNGQPPGPLQRLWREWKRCDGDVRHHWRRSVQLHAEGDTKGCDRAEQEARAAEVRAREIEERIVDALPQSTEDALVYARLLADYVGQGMLDDRRDALVANKLIKVLENLVKAVGE